MSKTPFPSLIQRMTHCQFGSDKQILGPTRLRRVVALEHAITLLDVNTKSRVEVWRGGLGRGLYSPVSRPFVCGCHKISTMPRFHTPLIEPDRRISRIRLSDKDSYCRSHEAAFSTLQAAQAQSLVEVCVGKP